MLIHSRSYHSSHFAILSRALHQSIKICLQIEHSGFLCVQIMMPVAENVPMGGHSGILEFKVSRISHEDARANPDGEDACASGRR